MTVVLGININVTVVFYFHFYFIDFKLDVIGMYKSLKS
jgi:hypothetical protein